MSEELPVSLTIVCIVGFSVILGYCNSIEAWIAKGTETEAAVMTEDNDKETKTAFFKAEQSLDVHVGAKSDTPVDKIRREIDKLRDLLISKNVDYGASAFESPSLMPGLTPTAAILVRMSDKINRLQTLAARSGEGLVKDETFDDTVRDLAGYCVLYLATKELRHGTQATS